VEALPGRADQLGTDVGDVRDAFLAALLAPDARRARQVVDDAADAGIAVQRLYCDAVQPAMHDIGRLWEQASISVAQEHLATQITQAVLARLAMRMTGSAQTGTGRTAVVTCSPGELHAVGAQMVSDFLEADGWRVLMLGADAPPDAVAATVREHGAELVALSTALPAHLLPAALTCQALQRVEPRPLVVAGGQAYRGDRTRALAVGADEFVDGPEALLGLLAERFGGDGVQQAG
jgi:methanogenic corrinoid protein MtbC1